MSLIKPNKTTEYGSQAALQKVVQSRETTNMLGELLGVGEIRWLSPLPEADFAEYRDEFPLLDVDVDLLHAFWPCRGPQWDGIFVDERSKRYFLVEAKAHISEIFQGVSAKDAKSIDLIRNSLREFASEISSREYNEKTWIYSLYQMANRLAFLNFLNRNAKKEWRGRIHFVNLVFLNDPISNKYSIMAKGLSETREAWDAAFYVAKNKMLGISAKNKLSKYIHTIYLNSPNAMQ